MYPLEPRRPILFIIFSQIYSSLTKLQVQTQNIKIKIVMIIIKLKTEVVAVLVRHVALAKKK